MRRRVHKILNFFAFNLLFFALYLNFVHKDNSSIPMAVQQPAAFSQTTVNEAGELVEKKDQPAVTQVSKVSPEEMAALNLSAR